MRRMLLTVCFLAFVAAGFAACGQEEDNGGSESSAGSGTNGGDTGETPGGQDSDSGDNDNEEEFDMNITIRIGSAEFSATLDDSATGRAFARMLPVTFDMSELNGNEKYFNLDTSLPTAASRYDTIHAGDLMLWGCDCVVLFYQTFSSGYSYTRIGRVDNPEGLAQAVGRGNIEVAFE